MSSSVSSRGQQTEASLLSDLSCTYFFFFPSWQPHSSGIQMVFARDAGVVNGAFLVFLLALFPFVLSLFHVLLATLQIGSFASSLLLGPVGYCLNVLLVLWSDFVCSVAERITNLTVSNTLRLLVPGYFQMFVENGKKRLGSLVSNFFEIYA